MPLQQCRSLGLRFPEGHGRVIVAISEDEPKGEKPRFLSTLNNDRLSVGTVHPAGSYSILPDPEIEPRSPALQADSLLSKPPGKPYFGVCEL